VVEYDTRKIKGIFLHAEVRIHQLLCSCVNIAVLALLKMFPIPCIVFQELCRRYLAMLYVPCRT